MSVVSSARYNVTLSNLSGINSKMDSRDVLLYENFSGAFPPDGWSTDLWKQYNSSCCGTRPPCARLHKYDQIQNNSAYITSKAVNVSNYKKVNLLFAFGADIVSENYCNIYVKYRNNETSPWEDITPWDNPIKRDFCDHWFDIEINCSPNDCGDALQINWTYIGDYFYCWEFCLDDVKIYFGDISKTLYVGGTGLDNYSSIQDAINDANNGDTVFVYDDSSPYYENLHIRKSIDLIGEDRDTTVIEGSDVGSIVYINADWVNISGFTIQNSKWGSYSAGIYIYLYKKISPSLVTTSQTTLGMVYTSIIPTTTSSLVTTSLKTDGMA